MSENTPRNNSFESWLSKEKRILIHAGGQSKRLPSYAVSGKVLMPLPVFRWERGQRLSQDLLSVQLPLYEKMMAMAPDNIHTMVVSGDVLIRATQPLQPIPEADVVCYGLWLDASVAKNHGVFVSSRRTPTVLKQMLQKPSVQTLTDLQKDHFYLTDIGVWMLSDKAVKLLAQKCSDNSQLSARPEGALATERDARMDHGKLLSMLWTWFCIAVSLVLFFVFNGWEMLKASLHVLYASILTSCEVFFTTAPTAEFDLNPWMILLAFGFVSIYLPYQTARKLSAIL